MRSPVTWVGANGIRPPENPPISESVSIGRSDVAQAIGVVDTAIPVPGGVANGCGWGDRVGAKYQGECHLPLQGVGCWGAMFVRT
jgi:hypothetical protein